MTYKKFEIWQIANDLVIKIHKMTLEELHKFEMFEEGSQIRRSSKSTKSLIVEAYGRRVYKQDFIRFLINSMSSNNETISHLDNLYTTESLKNKELYSELLDKLELLDRKLNKFICSVQQRFNIIAESEKPYQESNIKYQESK